MLAYPEAQPDAQAKHRVVCREDMPDHRFQPARARHRDEGLEHAPAQALSLPGVGDGNGELARPPVRVGDIAGYRELLFPTLILAHRHECHLAVIVDLCEAHQHPRRQLAHRGHEAEVTAAIREIPYELLLD